MKKPLIILTGPTAVGKTALSIALAKAVNGAVISADSMQVYKYMDIGSAKITREEMQGVPHYLIDEFMPQEEFNIVLFQKYAKSYMEEIYEKGQIPILTGGTGFYIQSVVYDIDFSREEADKSYRKELEDLSREKGALCLYEMLKEKDPKAAEEIHPNNIKRVIRALEYYHENGGEKISEHNKKEREKSSPYNFAYFVLNDEREKLYQAIETRVDDMISRGLIGEVEKLKKMGCKKGMVSMQGLGYKEILSYLNGEISLEEAVYIIKRDTRHFAKRQLTWFGREKDVIWMEKPSFGYNEKKILDFMLRTLSEKNII
ncbi:tRNA (adenosine(37)-N6)-dimethylallyltransferase MiaA [Roseburia sp. 1XD42-69]|uniref:tRNA (adenosine(37)-N6)-dimethylallyltransferase MiaA n=1 Tax=Roseburia sp. 1XD42-69 TaxID=2320088 RepID=UPI000EA0A841|nr:tRNA (adenosine(37)-N6)-dimethylallyltransferase MiaA [Roseburia sp. 1XD42-69]MCX4319723.1 tRNA (adenosine(37)-N6)-dimethylallyltransferase MiaA [Lachnospiraceae bacterium]RKJ65023.1 tRNA (adenosine(37)-N6)-dimethylallyltransferase MiaA [Roseburia sp. 1XD42-69]